MISVIVATFGEPEWEELALERAVPSAYAQTTPAHEVIFVHGSTLHGARNQGAQDATGKWLLFLDADDELDGAYVAAMEAKIATLDGDWLVRPATLGIRADGVEDAEAVVLPECRLLERNFMVIGTLVPRALMLEVGGFHDWPIYEDWDLWLRCHRAGAKFAACPEAIYRVHVRDNSRNYQGSQVQVSTYQAIRRANSRSTPGDRRKGRPR